MRHILIWGLKSPIGGVENVIINYLRHFNSGEIVPDIMFKGDTFPYEKEIEEMGGKVIYMPSYLPNIWKYKKIVKSTLKEGKYDVVWCNFSGLTNIEVLKSAKEFGVSSRVAHSHVTKLSWGSKLAKVIVLLLHYVNKNKIDRYATDYWCCTEDAGRFMFPKSVWKELAVKKNAIDLNKFKYEKDDHCDLVLGHIGRFTYVKNQKFIIDIFLKVLDREPNARLMLIGSGELEDELKEYAERLGIISRIDFMTNVLDASKYYSKMDVFLLPSHHEGFPLVLVEAQANGLPCIASKNVSNLSKILPNFYFLDLDVDEWVNKIFDIAGNRIENSKDYLVKEGYDINCVSKEIEEFL